MRFDFGGGVNNTNAFTGPWGGTSFVYTDWGSGMPDGNLNDGGARPIRIGAMGHYVYSGGGVRSLVLYRGVLSAGHYTWGESGGGWQTRIEYTSGTLNFGRNTSNGGYTNDSHGGGWSGGICGWLDYYFVPTPCRSLSISKSGRSVTLNYVAPASDGGSGITNYVAQIKEEGGSWTSQQNDIDGNVTWTGLAAGKTYRTRVLAQNAVGNSPWVESGTVFIPPAGKRIDDSLAAVGITLARRMTSPSTYVDQTIGKRYSGSAWVDFV